MSNLELPEVDALTVGFVGQPGARTFYLQVWRQGPAHSFKVEKQQVAAMGTALRNLLADIVVTERAQLPDLVDPGVPDWIVGTMGVSTFDESTGTVTLVLQELVLEDVDDDEPDDLTSAPDLVASEARISLTIPQLAALADRCDVVVEGGRPSCDLCGRPMDAEGHVCPKTNGSAKH